MLAANERHVTTCIVRAAFNLPSLSFATQAVAFQGSKHSTVSVHATSGSHSEALVFAYLIVNPAGKSYPTPQSFCNSDRRRYNRN